MKAVIYNKRQAQQPLSIQEVAIPVPGEGEVLVKIHTVSINAADYRSMQLGIEPKNGIYGADIAGQVQATGTNCIKFKANDEVFGDISGCGFGGFAEYAAVPERILAPKPAAVTHVDAASLPIAGITALQGLRDAGKLQPGQSVLIYGAGGGVGTFAVQLAKLLGARVTAVCGLYNVEMVRSLGADQVVDYIESDILTGSQRFDLVLAINGNHSLFAYKRVLAPRGIFVLAGGAFPQIIQTMLLKSLFSIGRQKFKFLSAKPRLPDLEYLIQLVEQGKIKPVIDRIVPLSETPEAVKYLRKGHARGKVVVSLIAD